MTLGEISKNKESLLAKTIKADMANKKIAEMIPVWKIFPNFRCPVIGSCLSIEEQKKIIKKTGFFKKGMSEFQIHHTLMEHICDENPVSLKTDRYIRHKYRDSIEKFKYQSEEELEQYWDSAFQRGELEGVFYLIATRPDISNDFIMKAFGDIHMLGHSNMSDLMKLKRALVLELDVNKKLAGRLNEEKTRIRQLNSLNKINKKRVSELENELAQLKKQSYSLQPDEATELKHENELIKNQNQSFKDKIDSLMQESCREEKDKQRIELKFSETLLTNKILKKEVQDLICLKTENFPVLCKEKCPGGFCKDCEKCPKKILMIGGMTKMKHYYKDIVESKGDEFLYHDGYMKSGGKQLKNLVYGSDLVLCPVNCNSHNACLRIKKLCKQFNKQVKMMSNSSLSSLSQVLNDNGVRPGMNVN